MAAENDQSKLSTDKRELESVNEERQSRFTTDKRTHFSGLGIQWQVVLGGNPAALMPQVVATVLQGGGTRPAWQWQTTDSDYVLMAWPKEEPIRAAVLMRGAHGDKLKSVDAFPLLEGLPNDFEVNQVIALDAGAGAHVAAETEEGHNPVWFYDPFFKRDEADLTPGVTHTFLLSGLAFSLNKALLDEMAITKGPYFEAHAEEWLKAHPDKKRLDVPPLKISLVGKKIIMPGANFCEYRVRTKIEQIEEHMLDKMKVFILYVTFPFEKRAPLLLPIYVSQMVLRDYTPQVGDDIDAYVWLQGRIIDPDQGQA